MKRKTWEETAKMCEIIYGSYIDWEERFFICPECDEPIYEEDWSEFELCPICEFEWFEFDEEEL